MKYSILTSAIGLATLVAGTPVADISARNALAEPDKGAAVTPAAIPTVTVSLVNMQASAISTRHQQPTDSPRPIGGPILPGTIPAGQTRVFMFPQGYKGNLVVANGQDDLNRTCSSLIEFSNLLNTDTGVVTANVDVSYVQGFTDAMTCSCNGRVVTGCATNLYTQGNTCPQKFGQCCANPKRNVRFGPPDPFFAPCAGKAYTYPKDDNANSYGECQGVPINCCVGTDCPKNVG